MHYRPLLAILLLSQILAAPSALSQDGAYAPNTQAVYPPGVQAPANVPANVSGSPGQMQAAPAAPPRTVTVGDWFNRYDQIRFRAQMSPSERQRADGLMSKGLSVLVPGEEKQATKLLLSSLVARYRRAAMELKQMPMIKPTQTLHQMYYQYFITAGKLFSDYVAVQDNLFVTDAASGQPVAAGLMQRKQMLEGLEHKCKELDGRLRQQFNIAPYQF